MKYCKISLYFSFDISAISEYKSIKSFKELKISLKKFLFSLINLWQFLYNSIDVISTDFLFDICVVKKKLTLLFLKN